MTYGRILTPFPCLVCIYNVLQAFDHLKCVMEIKGGCWYEDGGTQSQRCCLDHWSERPPGAVFFSAYTVQWGHADLALRPDMIHTRCDLCSGGRHSRDSTLVACGHISTPITIDYIPQLVAYSILSHTFIWPRISAAHWPPAQHPHHRLANYRSTRGGRHRPGAAPGGHGRSVPAKLGRQRLAWE